MARVFKSVSTGLSIAALLSVASALAISSKAMAYPKPSIYPVVWELRTKVDMPKRLVVDGKPYWYVTYHVTNDTRQERVFLPLFEMLFSDGKLERADRLIPPNVFNTIKSREPYPFLQSYTQIASDLRIGEDQSKDGVAIWEDTDLEGREFTVFFAGFSGESAKVAGPDGKDVTLMKTLQVDYAIGGDPKFRDINQVREVKRSFVMR